MVQRADNNIHTIAPAPWGLTNTSAQISATFLLCDVRVAALQDLAPPTGACMSEVSLQYPFHNHTRLITSGLLPLILFTPDRMIPQSQVSSKLSGAATTRFYLH